MSRVMSLREALELAQAHIGWCWDKIEEHTRLRREGSQDVHERIQAALDAEPIGYTLSVVERGQRLPLGAYRVWYSWDTYWSYPAANPEERRKVSARMAAQEVADFINMRLPEREARVVPLYVGD